MLETKAGELYLSPCSPIRAADCTALCCLNTEGGKWQSCGFTQGVAAPLSGAEFNGVDGFQVTASDMLHAALLLQSHCNNVTGEAQRPYCNLLALLQ